MPCSDAMIKEVITASLEQTVADALALFDKHKIRAVPVLDEQRNVIGMFNFHNLMIGLLPLSATLEGDDLMRMKHLGISLDHLTGMAPWVVKRLNKLMPRQLSDVMSKEFDVVHPETPLREGIRLIVHQGAPVPVVDPQSKALVGLITSQGIIRALIDMQGKESEEE